MGLENEKIYSRINEIVDNRTLPSTCDIIDAVLDGYAAGYKDGYTHACDDVLEMMEKKVGMLNENK